ncbi:MULTISPECIES: HAD family hydrolase [Ornithinimicrobium]|uniref:HAD family hydrolase n=2 Tax=Ornithinimicrobium kibberense TaxID=282060 RepID=A0ABV5V4F8_9MICO
MPSSPLPATPTTPATGPVPSSDPAGQPALPAAVLWDMDGTLVDTEPYWMAEETALVEAAGGTWSHEEALGLVGNDLMVSAQVLLERTPVTGTREQVVDALVSGVAARMRTGLPWRPGAPELLADLRRQDVPCALVTMSWTALADVLLEHLPAGTFAAVVTGDQVERGKPHPDPYLEAARRLAVEPQDCVALEDSPTGATSATAAGVPTLVVPNVVEVPRLAGAVRLGSLVDVTAEDLLPLLAAGT